MSLIGVDPGLLRFIARLVKHASAVMRFAIWGGSAIVLAVGATAATVGGSPVFGWLALALGVACGWLATRVGRLERSAAPFGAAYAALFLVPAYLLLSGTDGAEARELELSDFFGASAQVVATLLVAIVVERAVTRSRGIDLNRDGVIFITIGLAFSLIGLVPQVGTWLKLVAFDMAAAATAGAIVALALLVEEPKSKGCPECGETIREEAVLCRFCGHSWAAHANASAALTGTDHGPGTAKGLRRPVVDPKTQMQHHE